MLYNSNPKQMLIHRWKKCEHAEGGSTIHTDCWEGYNSEEGEKTACYHFTVNHENNFFADPTMDVQCLYKTC